MELSRRRLFVMSAASATAATAGLAMAPGAHATTLADDPGEQSPGNGTNDDQSAQQQNPANKLGCPLGKGL